MVSREEHHSQLAHPRRHGPGSTHCPVVPGRDFQCRSRLGVTAEAGQQGVKKFVVVHESEYRRNLPGLARRILHETRNSLPSSGRDMPTPEQFERMLVALAVERYRTSKEHPLSHSEFARRVLGVAVNDPSRTWRLIRKGDQRVSFADAMRIADGVGLNLAHLLHDAGIAFEAGRDPEAILELYAKDLTSPRPRSRQGVQPVSH